MIRNDGEPVSQRAGTKQTDWPWGRAVLGVILTFLALVAVGLLFPVLPATWLAYQVPVALAILTIWPVFVAAQIVRRAHGRIQFAIAVLGAAALTLAAVIEGAGLVLLMVYFAGLAVVAISGLVLVAQWLRNRARGSRTARTAGTAVIAMAVSAIGLWASLAIAPDPVPSGEPAADEALEYVYETDQSDRLSGRFVFTTRDAARRRLVLRLEESGAIERPQAKYHAAMVLQHGTCPEHFETAHRLASAAASEGVDGAEWLAEATFDRWQLSLGNPQRYGTQVGSPGVGRPCY